MNLEDCLPGTIVQTTLCGNLLTGVIERLDGVVAALRQVERDDGKPCDKPWYKPWWFHASLLTLAPRFLVNGEWVTEERWPAALSGYVCYRDDTWHWVALPEGEWEPGIRGTAPTYAAASQAVEKAVGLG